MFLRFVNPAIVSPYEAGILEKKPLPRIERGLKLMSKVRVEVWAGCEWAQKQAWKLCLCFRFCRASQTTSCSPRKST